MRIKITEDPMTLSNRLRLIYSKYKDVNLFLTKRGICITYTDWNDVAQELIVAELG